MHFAWWAQLQMLCICDWKG